MIEIRKTEVPCRPEQEDLAVDQHPHTGNKQMQQQGYWRITVPMQDKSTEQYPHCPDSKGPVAETIPASALKRISARWVKR